MKKDVFLLFLTFLCIGQLRASQEKWNVETARHEKEMEVVKQYYLKNIDDPEMILLFSFYQGKEWLRRTADLLGSGFMLNLSKSRWQWRK